MMFLTDGRAVDVFDTSGRTVFGGEPAPVRPPLPEPLDATTAALRPDGRVIFRVRVPEDYPTVSSAVAAGRQAQQAQMHKDRILSPTPHHWIQIVIGPGHYTDTITPPPYTSLIGAGVDQTVIEQDGSDSLGVLQINGRTHVEGIAFLKTTPLEQWKPKYPVHNASHGTTVWADCGFYTESVDLTRDVGRASGNDGVEGGTVLFYRCRFNGRADSHGWDTDTIPQTVMFVDCESSSTVGFRSGTGGAGAAADETWVVGGRANRINVEGLNAVLHLDPAAVGAVSTSPGLTVTDRTDWPLPVGSLTEPERIAAGL